VATVTGVPDDYYSQRYFCFACDTEWTYRESIPVEVAGLLFHNDQVLAPVARRRYVWADVERSEPSERRQWTTARC
jgi:hypothetical protein